MTWVDDRMAELRKQDRAWRAERERGIAASLRLSAAIERLGIDELERLADAAERIAGGG